jgi:large subunit ribosomal protein L7/L12
MSEGKETKVEEQKPEEQKPQAAASAEVSEKVKAVLKAVMELSAGERHAFIAEYVGNLSVLELNEQVKVLEVKFGVSAAPSGMMMAAAPAAAAAAPEEKTTFTIVLKGVGEKKIQVIKTVRAVTNLGLKEAKALVDGAPGIVKEGVTKEEAQKIKTELEQAGASVEVK